MAEYDLKELCINQAQQLEIQGAYKEAEELFLKVNELDFAIQMYKKARQYDHIIRLVSTYREWLLTRTHDAIAKELEREGDFKKAEYHHVQAGQYRNAVRMYQDNGMWEDAIRCAELHGLPGAAPAVVEKAIDDAIGNLVFEEAIHLANTYLKSKLPYVYLKHAMYLEDEGRFKEAEEGFVKAGKPKEAVDMYIHLHQWNDAMRVAESYDPSAFTDIRSHAAFERHICISEEEYSQAEQFLLKANKPEMLVKIYQEAKMWVEARRIAKEYAPNKLQDVNLKYAEWLQSQDKPIEEGKLLGECGGFAGAVESCESDRTIPRIVM